MYKDFQRVGRQLLLLGLITSHGGNASVRRGDKIFITRHASMLGDLSRSDIVKVTMGKEGSKPLEASKELPVHEEIYKNTAAIAIIHAHPPHAITMSLLEEMIRPVDTEGAILLGEVPVIVAREAVGSMEVARPASETLKSRRVVMVRGHGSFAVGEDLLEALCYTSALEDSCKILLMLKGLVRGQGQ